MIKINLVSDYQEKKLETKRVNKFATIFAATLLAILFGSLIIIFGITIAEKSVINSTNKDITKVRAEINNYKELEETVISLEKGLKGAKDILDGKNQWTKLLVHLEKAAPADVKYVTLKLSSDGTIAASLKGKNIDSMARYIESQKNYTVLTLTGKGNPGEEITVSNGDFVTTTMVKLNGTWVAGVYVDPATTQEISITKTGTTTETESEPVVEQQTKLTYDPKTKQATGDNNISSTLNNLFTEVTTKGYKKETGDEVSFSIDMIFNGSAIW